MLYMCQHLHHRRYINFNKHLVELTKQIFRPHNFFKLLYGDFRISQIQLNIEVGFIKKDMTNFSFIISALIFKQRVDYVKRGLIKFILTIFVPFDIILTVIVVVIVDCTIIILVVIINYHFSKYCYNLLCIIIMVLRHFNFPVLTPLPLLYHICYHLV